MFTLGHSQGNSNKDFWARITERELNMELQHQKKLEKLRGDTMFTSVEPVKINKITSFIKKGKLQFKNPKDANETLVATPTSVKSTSNTEFSWNGKFDEDRGDIVIIAHDGDIFGRFNIDNEVYEIQDLGHNKNVLVKFDKTKSSTCGNHPAVRNGISQPIPSTSLANSMSSPPPLSCDNNVRILVLFTPKVGQFQNPTNIATLAVDQLNTSIRNSGITNSELSFTLAGVTLLPGIIEQPSALTTLQNFKTFTNDGLLRDQFQADLVVLLTEGNYQNGEGGIGSGGPASIVNGQLDLGDDRWRCLVNTNIATAFYGFSHEVGHLFFCDHEDPQSPFVVAAGFPADRRSMKFTTRQCRRCYVFFTCCTDLDRQTIMTAQTSTNSIPHFSNPAISFQGVSTGVLGERNNVRMLKSNACQISDYKPFTMPMGVGITGPNYCNGADIYTWNATVSNCPNVTNVNWEFSTNGIDYFPFGSGTSLTTYLPVDPSIDPFVFLRVTATCSNGNTATDYLYVNTYVSYYLRNNNSSEAQAPIKKSMNDTDILISPNPSSDKVQISIKTEDSDLLTITLHDATGKTLKSITNAYVSEGVLQFDIDVKEFPNGIYLLRMQNDSKTVTHKLIIQK